MIQLGHAVSTDELQQIIDLQAINLPSSISAVELAKEGFVTFQHSLSLLQEMNSPYPHIIAKDGNRVIAYALCMLKEYRIHIPASMPLFEKIDDIYFSEKKIRDRRYYVMGQICIAKEFRGQGIFEKLYQQHKRQMSAHFDFVLTSVAYHNPRSMRAHEKVGFDIVQEYHDDAGAPWAIMLWNFENE
jgi:ribosomal protein S18 acetylase RimI-like enzyme